LSRGIYGRRLRRRRVGDELFGKKERIARRIAQELRDGYYVNLGIGLPTMIASYVPAGIEVIFHSENGMLGWGRRRRRSWRTAT